ncbi:hypothetical protein HMPREF9946_04143 [Acetobacteraceae bacterium AT-5844]|nr:hypothetical protein HMPREF9946_04143 [Acetobacteraceae bacterium AT-5844]
MRTGRIQIRPPRLYCRFQLSAFSFPPPRGRDRVPGDAAAAWGPWQPVTNSSVDGGSTVRRRHIMGRGILLWLLGVPIPVIILLALLFR